MSLAAELARDLEQSHARVSAFNATDLDKVAGQKKINKEGSDLPLFAAAQQLEAKQKQRSRKTGYAFVLGISVLAVGAAIYFFPAIGDISLGKTVIDSKPLSSMPISQRKVEYQPDTPTQLLPLVDQPVLFSTAGATTPGASGHSSPLFATTNDAGNLQKTERNSESNAQQSGAESIAAPPTNTVSQPNEQAATKKERTTVIKTPRPITPEQRDKLAVEQASLFLVAGDNAKALLYLQRQITASDLSSKNMPNSTALYATLLANRGDYLLAEKILSPYLLEYPSNPSLHTASVRIAIGQQNYAAALTKINALTLPLQNDLDILELKAAALQATGDFPAAGAIYQQLLLSNNVQGRWWMGLAVALDGSGRNIEARQAYLKALQSQQLSADISSYARQRIAAL